MTQPDFLTDRTRGCAPGKVDPEIFFANPRTVEGDREKKAAKKQRETARRICRDTCPFTAACFLTAERNGEPIGIWGGVDMAAEDEVARARAFFDLSTPAVPAPEPAVQESDEAVIARMLRAGAREFRAIPLDLQMAVVNAGITQGMDMTTLADRFNCGVRTLHNLIGPDALDAHIKRMYGEQKSDTAIALILGCSTRTVAGSRARQELPALFGPNGHRITRHITRSQAELEKHQLAKQVRELYDRDLSDTAIAAQLGVRTNRVHKVRTKVLGLPAKFGAKGKRLAVPA